MKSLFLIFLLFSSLPGFAQEDEEKIIDEVTREKNRELHRRKTIVEGLKETFEPLTELKKLGHDEISASTFMDSEAVKVIQRAMLEANLADRSPEMLRAIVRGHIKGTAWEQLAHVYPGGVDLAAEIMGDRQALPQAMGLFIRKEDLKIYGYIMLFLTVLSLYIRRRMSNAQKSWGRWSKALLQIVWTLGFFTLSFGIFWFMFEAEITPLARVVFDYYT